MLAKINTGILIATLIAAIATLVFQALEMDAYSLFETLLK